MTTASTAATTTTTSKPVKTGHIDANGVNYYYEIHGKGEPVLLLHGGLGSIDMFQGVWLPALAKSREVIAVDLHGHGRTPLGNRTINYVDLGNDMATLLDKLGYKQVDAIGYSMGAAVAFRLSIQHSDKVRRLALVSAGFSPDGFYPEMRPMQSRLTGAMAPMMKDTPMYKSYVEVAPNPSEFPKLLDQMGELMRTEFNWADDVKKLQTPVILVWGDSDMFRPEHMVEFYKLVGGGQRDAGWQREHMSKNRMAILPNVTHYDMCMSQALVPTVLPFLDGNQGQASWAEQVAKQ
ncbi:MAG TPA: alpha/beta hydrolase [Kofleriaceae bacterium]|nr:alpha/beta hydrolase [Kofleriaceae bacterium]